MTSAAAPPAPAAAARLFGARLPLAQRYADRLAGDGVGRGLLGPREVARVWERHVLNCAVLTDLLPKDAAVVDVGSGAGLPGLPMALRRADLRVTLVEPMLRRTVFLEEAVAALDLGSSVRVVRGRADDPDVRQVVGGTDWVVARAVAPLDRLVKWCLPLLAPGGTLLALKGASAAAEVAAHGKAVRRAGAEEIDVRSLGADVLSEPTWVVRVRRASEPVASQRRGKA